MGSCEVSPRRLWVGDDLVSCCYQSSWIVIVVTGRHARDRGGKPGRDRVDHVPDPGVGPVTGVAAGGGEGLAVDVIAAGRIAELLVSHCRRGRRLAAKMKHVLPAMDGIETVMRYCFACSSKT